MWIKVDGSDESLRIDLISPSNLIGGIITPLITLMGLREIRWA